MSKSAFLLPLVILTVSLVTGCTTMYKDHGYLPLEESLNQVAIGKDNRGFVTGLLGSPIGSGVLDDGAIFYISTRIKTYLFYEPKVVSRDMIVVSFDSQDKVSNVERFSLEDGRIVVLSRRVTEAPVKGPKILSQILGNFGNVSADDLLGQ
ncbi:MAG: outer membrane protein assembly factor BamE [Amylibacter sp.]|jgi:outer membrane protein assembly factor BamE (lipoprotein component of BamABCDE complex)|tara:strand:+ start:28896 stop:29348 length:453 start_codon:yes stop_codon:yes gene_type:complete